MWAVCLYVSMNVRMYVVYIYASMYVNHLSLLNKKKELLAPHFFHVVLLHIALPFKNYILSRLAGGGSAGECG